MKKWIRRIVSLTLILCLSLPAISTVYATPVDIINNILSRSNNSNNSTINNTLIQNALNKTRTQQIKIIDTKKELQQIVEEDTKQESSKTNKTNENSYMIGIDISKWNGDIDWEAVKKANIEFVIIRAGYGTGYVDPYFKKNIENAIKYDMLIGIYWFSYAYTYQSAKLEAEKCYKTIEPYKDKIDLPVFFDFEYDSVNYAKRHGRTISKELASGIADTFCINIKNKGMQAGIYTNMDYSKNYFTEEVLAKYHTWIAQWTGTCTYKDKYIIWQCSDKFYIKGKRFDLNYYYYNRYNKNTTQTRKTITVSATAYSGDGITSTGIKPRWGIIAVDPGVIPYGSMVYIPEFDKYFIAEDCGGAIKGNRIDIFMNSEQEARNWGVRKIKIQVLQ